MRLLLVIFLSLVLLYSDAFSGITEKKRSYGVSDTNPPFLIEEVDVRIPLNGIRNIYIDVRSSRGGNGDVSSGFLAANEYLYRHDFKGKIYLLVDDEAKKILQDISGIRSITNGTALFNSINGSSNIICYSYHGIPADGSVGAADIFISLAKPSGIVIGIEETYIGFEKYDKNTIKWIPVKKDTFYVFQTVLGNTENKYSKLPLSSVLYKGVHYLMHPAGIGKKESGIYWDYVAAELRGKKHNDIAAYLRSSLNDLKSARDQDVIEKLINVTINNDGNPVPLKLGMVYGVTHSDVHAQFGSYLDGIAKHGSEEGHASIIISPSKITAQMLAGRDVAIWPMESLVDLKNLKRTPGAINVILTQNLTHKVFTGLLAYSQFVPVIAGDAALSAAIIIGKPFVMTKIAWNERNIRNLVNLLKLKLPPSLVKEENYQKIWTDFLNANLSDIVAKLSAEKDAFYDLNKNIFFLSDKIRSVFNLVRDLESNVLSLEMINKISDVPFKMYKMLVLAFKVIENPARYDNMYINEILAAIKEIGDKHFIDSLVYVNNDSKKYLERGPFLIYLKEILSKVNMTDSGAFVLDMTLDEFFFKLNKTLDVNLFADDFLSIVQRILEKLSGRGIENTTFDEMLGLLNILKSLKSKKSTELIEKYFLFKTDKNIAARAFVSLMFDEYSIFMKNPFRAFDFFLNNALPVSDVAWYIRDISSKLIYKENNLTIYGWNIIELLKRPGLVFLMYGRYKTDLDIRARKLLVQNIGYAMNNFSKIHPTPSSIDICKILVTR